MSNKTKAQVTYGANSSNDTTSTWTVDRRSLTMAAVLGAAGLAVGAGTRTAQAAESDEDDAKDPTIISVSASAERLVTPDVADVALSIEAAGTDATEVQDEVVTKSQAAKQAIIDAGIEEDSVAISGIDLYPEYEDDDAKLISFGSSDGPSISGYRASTNIKVTGIAVDKVGTVIDAATGAGVNSIDSIAYTLSTYNQVYDDALTEACTRGREKADVMAKALGGTISRLSYANEGYENTSARATYTSSSDAVAEYAVVMDADAGTGAAASVQLDPGTLEITASVNMAFELE